MAYHVHNNKIKCFFLQNNTVLLLLILQCMAHCFLVTTDKIYCNQLCIHVRSYKSAIIRKNFIIYHWFYTLENVTRRWAFLQRFIIIYGLLGKTKLYAYTCKL